MMVVVDNVRPSGLGDGSPWASDVSGFLVPPSWTRWSRSPLVDASCSTCPKETRCMDDGQTEPVVLSRMRSAS